MPSAATSAKEPSMPRMCSGLPSSTRARASSTLILVTRFSDGSRRSTIRLTGRSMCGLFRSRTRRRKRYGRRQAEVESETLRRVMCASTGNRRSMLGAPALIALACGGSPTAASPQAPGGWSLVFSDEFNSAGSPTRRNGPTSLATFATTRSSSTLPATERPRRRRQPRHRGAQGGVPGLRLHLGQHQHARAP